MLKKDIKSIIMVIDQNFGFNQIYKNQLVGISVFNSIFLTLNYFKKNIDLNCAFSKRKFGSTIGSTISKQYRVPWSLL